MAIAFRAAGAVTTGNNVANKPSGTLQGDLMIALINNQDQTSPTCTPPSGWTQIGTVTQQGSGSGSIAGFCFWKIAGASEPTTYTFTTSGWTNTVIASYSGCDGTTPVDVSSEGNGASNPSLPAVTTHNANEWLIALLGDYNGTAYTSPPANMTQDILGTGMYVAHDSADPASAGTYGPFGWTAADKWIGFLVAINPPLAGAAAAPAAASAHGQWPLAPLRSTQRVSLTAREHNAWLGVSASDVVPTGNLEQFYGDGTGTAPPEYPRGQWPNPERETQRTALAWRSHNSGTGTADNDLVAVAPGLSREFFGLWYGTPDLVLAGTVALQANAALVETAAQVVDPSVPLQANAVLSETAAQVVTPSAPLQANAVLSGTSAQIVEPAAPLQANAALVESAAQIVEPTAPLVVNAVLDSTTNGAQVVEPSAPLVVTALLVVTGSSVVAPTTAVSPAVPHGLWPMAPLRTTQRVPLMRVEHNADVGVAASDLTVQGNLEQFYGDGTQVLPMKPPFGAWATSLRSTQRAAGFIWQPHDTAGAANDLLTVPTGQTYQFFGIPDVPGVIPAQGAAVQVNAALQETGAQVVEPAATPAAVQVNAALVESTGQVMSPSAAVTVNAALVETAAQLVAPSGTLPLSVQAALATGVAVVVAFGQILQANALLVATGSSFSGSIQPPYSGSLVITSATGGSLTPAGVSAGALVASVALPAGGAATSGQNNAGATTEPPGLPNSGTMTVQPV